MRYALVVAALLVGTTAYAGGPGCKHGAKMDEVTAGLNLDATQTAQVQEILKSSHERMRSKNQTIHEDTLNQLRAVLSDEQMQTLQANWEQMHKAKDTAEEGV